MSYTPTPRIADILNWCLGVVQSVPYKVTARWLFYRLIQDRGLTKGKYKNFLKWTSKARKNYWNGWRPDTLTDDGRTILDRGRGYETVEDWIESMRDQKPPLDAFTDQEHIVLVLYEAAAMSSQFNYVLEPRRITSAPFKGDSSIPHKWSLAKWLEQRAVVEHPKPIVVLYFGDLDSKGLEIPINALKDIYEWMTLIGYKGPLIQYGEHLWSTEDRRFRWIRCGINQDQVEDLDIPENFEKPGTYQWEALDDEEARGLILSNLTDWWSQDALTALKEREVAAGERWQTFIAEHIDELLEEE